jgi:hypothetical protein
LLLEFGFRKLCGSEGGLNEWHKLSYRSPCQNHNKYKLKKEIKGNRRKEREKDNRQNLKKEMKIYF